MAAFQINEKTYRATSFAEALNDALFTYQEGVDLNLYVFQIKGKVVSREEFVSVCRAAWDKAAAKKAETHKEIWVHQGASNAKNAWHKKWVKR